MGDINSECVLCVCYVCFSANTVCWQCAWRITQRLKLAAATYSFFALVKISNTRTLWIHHHYSFTFIIWWDWRWNTKLKEYSYFCHRLLQSISMRGLWSVETKESKNWPGLEKTRAGPASLAFIISYLSYWRAKSFENKLTRCLISLPLYCRSTALTSTVWSYSTWWGNELSFNRPAMTVAYFSGWREQSGVIPFSSWTHF